MNTSIKLLANLEFANLLTEACQDVQTSAGQSLIGKYQQYLLVNECTYKLVNDFLKEAVNCNFDNAVANVSSAICGYINENKYSWQLASACENVRNNTTSYNFLGRNACKQVEDLLENKSEREVVNYVKAGALKNVMFVEQFRNITNSIFKGTPIVESCSEYTAVTPFSMVETNENGTFFEVNGKIFNVSDDCIREAMANEVSNDFLVVSRLLESNNISFANDTFTVQVGNALLETKSDGKCTKKKCKDGKCIDCGKELKECTCEGQEMTVAQLREHNEMFMNALGRHNAMSKYNATILESFAKLCENYDNIMQLDNVKVITTAKDKFLIIEHNGNVHSELIQSNHAKYWDINENVVDALARIKSKTNVDLNEEYADSVATVLENVEEEEAERINESLYNDDVQETRERIERLTEQYKHDPAKLAVLSKLAAQLNETYAVGPIGDPGATKSHKIAGAINKAKTFVNDHKKGVAIGAGVAAAGAAAYGIHKLRQRNKAKKAAQQQGK